MRMKWIVVLVAALMLAGCGVGKGPTYPGTPGDAYKPGTAAEKPPAAATTPKVTSWAEPPAMKIDTNKQYFATFETSLGNIRMELLTKQSPKGVNNFVFLAREGFYDGVVFHRIIKNFMIQSGDPTGTGGGGPGYKFPGEQVTQSYEPGIVAYANTGHPDTQGSQFFICSGDNCRGLNPNPIYTQFGKVVEGMDVVEELQSVEVTAGPDGNMSKPKTPPVIKRVVIEER